MQYALLIYGDETKWDPESEAGAKSMEDYGTFTEDIQQRGLMVGGEALHPTEAATTVRVRDGETMVSDGPFAETKEQLGGFYLIEAADLDEAIGVAEKLPGSWDGSVEIRPVAVFDT